MRVRKSLIEWGVKKALEENGVRRVGVRRVKKGCWSERVIKKRKVL